MEGTAGLEDVFVGFWSHRKIRISLELMRAGREEVLRRAAHAGTRNSGGLPISPFSLGAAALSAGVSHADGDQLPSMLDDIIRRSMRAFPNISGQS